MPVALLALALSAFGIGTTEFVIMGLLPEVAGDFGVSIPVAGYLISGYALGVVVGAPLLTVARVPAAPQDRCCIALMVLFIVGNLLAAVAPTYARADGRPGRRRARARRVLRGRLGGRRRPGRPAEAGRAPIALMFTGLTVANVLGVPLGTALGQTFGWRVDLPGRHRARRDRPARHRRPRARASRDPRARACARSWPRFRSPCQVWLAMAMTVLGFGGVFAAVHLHRADDDRGRRLRAPASVTWLLVLFGIGLVVGNLRRRTARRPGADAEALRHPRDPRRRARRVRAHRAQQGRLARHHRR